MSSSSMSKEKLKTELQSRNIPLPPAGSKKEVYVHLYQKYFNTSTAQAREPRAPEFSSDEEDAYRNTHMKEKTIFTTVLSDNDNSPTVMLDGVRVNISDLSDDELRQYLTKYNVAVGPIVDTTRSVYERKLARIMRGEVEGEKPNGQYVSAQDEYSDSEGENGIDLPTTPPQSTFKDSPSAGTRSNKKHEDSPKPVVHSVNDGENILSKRNFARETPTPRRSLRDNISYTPADRSLYADIIRQRDEERVNKLASKVVENTPEPTEKKQTKNSSMIKKLFFIMLLVALISVFVYYNMEGNNREEISQLPPTKI